MTEKSDSTDKPSAPPKPAAPKPPTPAQAATTTDQALADERAALARPAAVKRERAVVEAIPQAENPPRQPDMVPAEQVYGTRGASPDRRPGRPPTAIKGIRVQATKLGYYDDKLRRVGDVFTIDGTEDAAGNVTAFSHLWMVEVAPTTPERLTSSNEDLRRQHDQIQAERLGIDTGPDTPTGAQSPLGA